MQNLREIGSRYNDLQDAVDELKVALRKCKNEEERSNLRRKLADKNRKLRQFKASLTGQELQAYKDYRTIRREIKRCEMLKRYDKIESKVFHTINPAYIYMLPAAFHSIFFTLMPFIFMIVGAFFKLDLVDIKNSKFVGLWNFRMVLIRDDEFWRAFGNTFFFAVITVFLLMVVTIFMSTWLSSNTKIHNIAQTMIFTPHISSMVAVGILWVLMLDPQGIINQMLAFLGIKGPNWLMDSRTSLLSVALVTVWKSIGYYCLILIAGLQSLPKDVYEAAKLDKASKWTILRKITLPLLTPTLSFVFIMKFINSFKSFAAIDVMTQGGPQGSSMVLGYWIYNAGRVKFNYGFAMVGAIVLTIMVAICTVLANKGFKKED
ncbi:MAG: ABC transporter permease subunit [Christensenellales bacterium]|jgi:sn-glycerol 3-phosphate transport system permease protein